MATHSQRPAAFYHASWYTGRPLLEGLISHARLAPISNLPLPISLASNPSFSLPSPLSARPLLSLSLYLSLSLSIVPLLTTLSLLIFIRAFYTFDLWNQKIFTKQRRMRERQSNYCKSSIKKQFDLGNLGGWPWLESGPLWSRHVSKYRREGKGRAIECFGRVKSQGGPIWVLSRWPGEEALREREPAS